MKAPRTPQFLGRESYRLRRLMDAARMLPVMGLVLLLLPLMRHSPEIESPPTATEGAYLFVVWAVLILAAFLLSLRLRRALDVSETGAKSQPESQTAAKED